MSEGLKPSYFTYGTGSAMDHYKGHIIIWAKSPDEARNLYRDIYGLHNDSYLGFAFQYTQEEWDAIPDHGFNKLCHAEYFRPENQ